MAIAMLIAGPDAAEPTVGPEAAARLAQIGRAALGPTAHRTHGELS